MIIVNIQTNAEPTSEGVRQAATGGWVIEPAAVSENGDGLLAVCNGRVVGAYRILGYATLPDQRMCFELEESARLAFLIGRNAPIGSGDDLLHARVTDTERVIDAERLTDELSARRRRRAATSRAATGASWVLSTDRPRVAGEWKA